MVAPLGRYYPRQSITNQPPAFARVQKKPDLLDAPLEAIPPAWLRLVVQTKPTYTVSRRAYTFAVLEQLHKGLKRHDVFVSPSQKWGDPRTKLLPPAAWEAARPQVCRSLGRSTGVAPNR